MSNLKLLPPKEKLDTTPVLKSLVSAHRYLAELKGVARSMPNQTILISTLGLQEAKDSSAVENIITTHDELYRETLSSTKKNTRSKEVQYYASALFNGFEDILEDKFLSSRHILSIHKDLERNNSGYRKVPGTRLINDSTRETVYIPPQDHHDILQLMTNLETYINTHDDDCDPLIKMAVIHYQFESIHPFYDGNGRTGRIINMLYLVLTGLLDIPILYMSRYIINHREGYYKGLRNVYDHNEWEAWILYMLEGVSYTAKATTKVIEEINSLFFETKHIVRDRYKFYSQDLINLLFNFPYTKVEFIKKNLRVSRLTATKYLDTLAEDGILTKEKVGRTNYYINTKLFQILSSIEDS